MRGTCQVCLRQMLLVESDGRVRGHGPWTRKCPGSWLPPLVWRLGPIPADGGVLA